MFVSTVIPTPLFVFSPGLIIQMFFISLSFFRLSTFYFKSWTSAYSFCCCWAYFSNIYEFYFFSICIYLNNYSSIITFFSLACFFTLGKNDWLLLAGELSSLLAVRSSFSASFSFILVIFSAISSISLLMSVIFVLSSFSSFSAAFYTFSISLCMFKNFRNSGSEVPCLIWYVNGNTSNGSRPYAL